MAKTQSTDKERMTKMETDIEYIKQKQAETEMRNGQEHQEIKTMLKEFIESANKKYASKLSEYLIYSLVAIIVSAVLYALLSGVTL